MDKTGSDNHKLLLKKSFIYTTFINKCNPDSDDDDLAKTLVSAIVKDASQRSKTIISHMKEFTLHDSDHLLQVLILMEKILQKPNIEKLYIPELMLLIMSAFYHDIGMAPDEVIIECWEKYWDSDQVIEDSVLKKEFEEFSKFCSGKPEELGKIEKAKKENQMVLYKTLKQYLICDFIRKNHADRARSLIDKLWNGKIKYCNTDLTLEFANICYSHTNDLTNINLFEKKLICGNDQFVCLPLIAIVLRLADILDFDMKRTPSILFSHLSVKNPVSLIEWKKHRSIEAWEINDKIIKFRAKCSHPAIQSAIHNFCDQIDKELNICNYLLKDVNDFHSTNERDMHITIPFNIDRTQIETECNIYGEPLYQYSETKFELSKNQVIDLLMGTKLYGSTDVALRELIQNSLDACLLRQALEEKWENHNYTPLVTIKYYKENDDYILEVSDNGIGMDQYIIDNYYSNIGKSFYTSSDFYALRAQTNSNFVPTSRFGIGILSCFMVADTVSVETRKLYGRHSSSEPLSIVIEGHDSIFWIKKGQRDYPGTDTKLILRKKNPWEELSSEDFISVVERVVPNPPFCIKIQSGKINVNRDENSFYKLEASSLKDYTWDDHDNLREIEIKLDNIKAGIVGSVIISILEKHEFPVEKIEMQRRPIKIEEQEFDLANTIVLKENEIEITSTTITIDENRDIHSSTTTRNLAKSKSRIALHGVEVPTTFFPEIWNMEKNQVRLAWPFPLLIIIDICGTNDIDLNSARNRIIHTEKWINFEEELAYTICIKLFAEVGKEYWDKLFPILNKSKSSNFINGLNRCIAEEIQYSA